MNGQADAVHKPKVLNSENKYSWPMAATVTMRGTTVDREASNDNIGAREK